MKKFKLILITLLIILIILSTISLSHSGRTDSSGGHNSPSGYHYHHGYPAHQHTNGICPYNYYNKNIYSSSENLNNNYNSNSAYYYTNKMQSLNTIDNTSIKYNSTDNKNTNSKNIISNIKSHPLLFCFIFLFIVGFIESILDKTIPQKETTVSTNISQNTNNLEHNNIINYKKHPTANYYKCPKCGGQLQFKNGKYGNFIGCKNYPYCKYTKSIKKR